MIFINRHTTMTQHTCVWILIICTTLAMLLTNCKGQAIEDNRLANALRSYEPPQISTKDLLLALYNNNADREKRMTDAGYGSRVQTASKLASALIAHHDLFGSYGPGRKKRLYTSGDNLLQRLHLLGDFNSQEV